MINSSGVLKYNYNADYGYKLIVEIDPGIVELARWLIPKTITLNKQRYTPHISVVRKEVPKENWEFKSGEKIQFNYDSYVYNDETYYWLRVYSEDLIKIRIALGLTPFSEKSRPPDGTDCFHITIGNIKKL